MTVDTPFCLGWFRRSEPNGRRPVDPITTDWLARLATGRHARTFADGAAGLIASEPFLETELGLAAFGKPSDEPDERRAFARHDFERIGRSSHGAAVMTLDSRGERFGLLRDPLGRHQLFYQDNGQLLVACTDLAMLLQRPGWVRRLDRAAACHYLAFGTPGLGRTLEAGTRSLVAGHLLEIEPDRGPFVRRYWSPLNVAGPVMLDRDRERALQRELDDAIVAAAGAGTGAMLLSGGIDSGYVAHVLAARGLAGRVDAYTIRFTSRGAGNEDELAAETARLAGVRHHVVEMTAAAAADRLPTVLTDPQPRSAWSVLTNAHLLDRIRGDGHGAYLSGLGADEVFGGYSHYLKAYRRFDRLLATYGGDRYEQCFDDLLARPDVAAGTLFTGVPRFLDDEMLQAHAGPALAGWSHVGDTVRFYHEARELRPRAHLFELMVAHECQFRIPDLLLAGFHDAAGGRSVSGRYPFLTPRIAGLACRLGAGERFGKLGDVFRNKLALRRIAATRLPPGVFDRPPMTFNAPFLPWLADDRFREIIVATLGDASSFPDDLLDRRWVSSLLLTVLAQDPAAPVTPEANQLWIVTTLVGWYRKWIGTGGAR